MIRTGLDQLIAGDVDLDLKGARCGLLCHAASVTSDLRHAVDQFKRVEQRHNVELRCLFAPEHGVFGDAQDMIAVASGQHPRLNVPVHSLYGSTEASLRPRTEWTADLDLVFVDLQDVGSRYYTYIWTMVMMAQACAAHGCRVVVLDRPNPIGGTAFAVEGPGIDPGFTSFVGYHPLPVRHGLTCGEVARLAAAELGLPAPEVVTVEGWQRGQFHDETGLPWVNPSPNMPSLETAMVYPGGCLLEGTNVSEGRGTTRPFELVGAPWVDGWALADALGREDLPGVRFRPTSFRPTFHKHQGDSCGGVQLHVTSRSTYRPLRTGVALLGALRRLWPKSFVWRDLVYEFVQDRPAIDLLAGGTWLREGIDGQASLGDLMTGWDTAEASFRERRRSHLLYPESREG